MTWALDHRQTGPLSPEHRLVLVALADYADPAGRGAWPSASTLADRLGVTVRAVRRSIAALEAAALIERGDQRHVEHYRGDRRPVVYDLALEGRQTYLADDGELRVEPHRHDRHGVTRVSPREAAASCPQRGDASVTPAPVDNHSRGDTHDTHGVTPVSPKPLVKPSPQTLVSKGHHVARERATAARSLPMAVERDEPDPRPLRPLGNTSATCPECGDPVLRTHRCRASALDRPTTRGSSIRDLHAALDAGEQPRLVVVGSGDLREHAPCTGCGVTDAHRPLIDGTGLCLRCVAAGGWQAVLDLEADQEQAR